MDTNDPAHAAPSEWVSALAESEGDIKAGQTVSIEPVLARMRACLDRMESRRAGQAIRSARAE